MIRPITIILLSILSTCPVPCHSQQPDRVLFERLVTSTKYFEGWHTQSKTPGHVGYGHKIQQGEHFRNSLTRRQADSLLRSDLIQHYRLYSRYGKDALLLSEISDNNVESYTNSKKLFLAGISKQVRFTVRPHTYNL